MTAALENAFKIYVILDQTTVLSLKKASKHGFINHSYIGNFVLSRKPWWRNGSKSTNQACNRGYT